MTEDGHVGRRVTLPGAAVHSNALLNATRVVAPTTGEDLLGLNGSLYVSFGVATLLSCSHPSEIRCGYFTVYPFPSIQAPKARW